MSQTNRDFWGDLDQPEKNTENEVLSVLEEQAESLATKTRGRLAAEIVPKNEGTLPLQWEFQLVAPFADFRYALFRVTQFALDFPVEITLYSAETQTYRCADLGELEDSLQRILQTPATRKAIQSVRAVDRLQGRHFIDLRTGALVVLEPRPRIADGTTYTATVSMDGDFVLEATVEVSGSAQAEQSDDELMKRVETAIEVLLAAHEPGSPIDGHPTIRLHSQNRTFIRERDGHLRPV